MRCSTCLEEIRDDAAFCPFCGSSVEGGPTYKDYRYEAFVSYRHLPRDQRAARQVQRALEGMAIPRGVRRNGTKQRLGKLFRDEDELPTSSSLNGQIEEALRQSPWLIVVCTPETQQSRWINREVELFASYHGRDRILIALAEGEPEESFPHLLLSRLAKGPSGTLVEVVDEPLAADLREKAHKRAGAEIARLAAPLIGCAYDDLRQRQRARQMRLATTVTAIVAAASTVFGTYSCHQQRQIEAHYRAAQANESESLAVEAEQLLAQGDRLDAIQVALSALPESSTANDRPLVPSAQLALEHALQVYPTSSLWRSGYAVKEVEGTYALSPHGLQAFKRIDGTVEVREVTSGTLVSTIDATSELEELTNTTVSLFDMQFCGNQLLCSTTGAITLFDPMAGTLTWRASIDGFFSASDITVSPDETRVAVGVSIGPARVVGDDRANTLIVRVINTQDGSVAQGFKLPLNEWTDHTDEVRFAFSPDGSKLAVGNSGRLWLVDLVTEDVTWTDLDNPGIYELTYLDDALVAVTLPGSTLSLYTDPATVVCLTPELYLRWSLTYEPDVSFDAHGLPYDNDVHVMGRFFPQSAPQTTSAEEDEGYVSEEDPFAVQPGPQLVLACGRTVRFIDEASGEEVRQTSLGAPLRTSHLDTFLHLADEEGTVMSYSLGEDGTPTAIAQLEVAGGSHATLGSSDGTTSLAAYDTSTSTYRIYRFTDRATAPSREPLQSKYLHANLGRAESGAGSNVLMSWDDTEVAALDPITLKKQWKRSFAKLGYSSGTIECACGQNALYVFEATHEGSQAPIISVIDYADGKPISQISLSEDWTAITSVSEQRAGERDVLVVRSASTVAVIDLASYEELVRITVAHGEIVDAWVDADTLLVQKRASVGETAGAFEVFSLADGSPTTAPITDAIPRMTQTPTGGLLRSMSPDGTTLVVSCSDGRLRAFAANGWTPLWESTEELPGLRALSFAADGNSLVGQDQSGIFLLVSTEDGHVMAASSAALPEVQSFWRDAAHPETLTAHYRYSGMMSDQGIATITLDSTSFGPTSDTFCGVCYAADGERVLAYDLQSEQPFATYHHYSLDELLELGRQAVEGHELTDAERLLYRID